MTDIPPVIDAPPVGDPPEPPKGLPDDPAILKDELEKVRREAARYRTERNELRPLADKAREADEATKTEIQKLTEAAAKATAEAEASRLELSRLRVATSKGLPPELASRLQGATDEEMAEDADRLLAVVKPAEPPQPPPPGDADGGPRGTPQPGQLTRADLSGMTPEQINDAREKGQLNQLLGIT